ncbi:unnamed protein product [Heligmosomoides polygyrus]|uniref:Uncharacterized protein n=1 Tax=Heligmosomoides polygyrus TaxID=6339 RepID=A0A183FP01_HELPZ|nr:unnamed protein product [Heligmosomoides polygyrus]
MLIGGNFSSDGVCGHIAVRGSGSGRKCQSLRSTNQFNTRAGYRAQQGHVESTSSYTQSLLSPPQNEQGAEVDAEPEDQLGERQVAADSRVVKDKRVRTVTR